MLDGKSEKVFRMKKRTILQVLLLAVIFLLPIHTVYAQIEDPPDDPGAGDDQDVVISDGLSWYFPDYGATWVDLNDPDIDITLDWTTLATAGKINTGDDQYVFVGVDSTSTTYILDEEAQDYYHPGEGDGEGLMFGLGLIQQLSGCDTVWLEPGKITATAAKTSPEYPVVVGQDPDDTGVSLTWSLQIQPTILYYENWQKIVQVVGCVNDSDPTDILELDCKMLPNNTALCLDPGVCPTGYSKQSVQLWGCVVDQKEYRENIASIAPEAALQAQSRDWILGDLAVIFPGAFLRHPIWSFDAPIDCIWEGDVCNWLYGAGSLPVEDPGWYDLIVSGITSGTKVTPPRSFRFTVGEFGVYFIDASSTE